MFLECFGSIQTITEVIVIFQVWHYATLFKIIEIQLIKVSAQTLFSIFKFFEEFLSMRSRLSGSSSFDVLLNFLPLFSIKFERLKKTEMFIFGPPTHFELTIWFLDGGRLLYALDFFYFDLAFILLELFGVYKNKNAWEN